MPRILRHAHSAVLVMQVLLAQMLSATHANDAMEAKKGLGQGAARISHAKRLESDAAQVPLGASPGSPGSTALADADHSFHVPKRSGTTNEQVLSALAALLACSPVSSVRGGPHSADGYA
jgi:hypothetical protein